MSKPILTGIIFLFLIVSGEISGQRKLIYTYIDYNNGELRAALFNEENNERADIGFNNTFLPAWFGNKILINSQSFIWISDTIASEFTKICVGFRASVSNSGRNFAVYTPSDISVYDSSLKLKKKIDVDYRDDVSMTWLFNDSVLSYFDAEKGSSVFYYLDSDSISVFGKEIFHPAWNPLSKEILYNKKSDIGYSVYIAQGRQVSDTDKIISIKDEFSIVPIWSNKFDKIAYLRIKEDSLQVYDTDLMLADLILFDIKKDKYFLIADDAGYTDQAYPQFTFDYEDENIYYTAISENSLGIICKVNINTLEKTILTKDFRIDERLPLFKKME